MDRDPGDFPARLPAKPFADMSEAEQDEWLESLPPPPGIATTDEEADAAISRAEADVAAGRVYPHALVGEWLETVGTSDFKPFREWLK